MQQESVFVLIRVQLSFLSNLDVSTLTGENSVRSATQLCNETEVAKKKKKKSPGAKPVCVTGAAVCCLSAPLVFIVFGAAQCRKLCERHVVAFCNITGLMIRPRQNAHTQPLACLHTESVSLCLCVKQMKKKQPKKTNI